MVKILGWVCSLRLGASVLEMTLFVDETVCLSFTGFVRCSGSVPTCVVSVWGLLGSGCFYLTSRVMCIGLFSMWCS